MRGGEEEYGRRDLSWQRSSYRVTRRRRRRPRTWSARLGKWTRAVIAFLFSNVGIVCLVVGYTIAGAFLFTHIEGKNSADVAGDVIRLRNLTAGTLWKLSAKENYAEDVWKAKAGVILANYQSKMVTAIRNGYDGMEESKKWSFAGAFLYSLTVITTIGYGNICPKTKWGKIITIVYAIIGMPLFLLYLSNIGDILAKSFKWTYARCCLCKCRKRTVHVGRAAGPISPAEARGYWQEGETGVRYAQRKEPLMVNGLKWGRRLGMRPVHADRHYRYTYELGSDSQNEIYAASDVFDFTYENGRGHPDEEGISMEQEDETEEGETEESVSYDPQRVTVPLTLCLTIMVGYIWGGAILFSEWEDWNMLDGSYFCFVSLSTIGFGDIVPGDKIYSSQGFELSFIFCSMYLMLGMALIAMCFNLMQEEVIAKMRTLLRIVKYIFRCDR